MATGSCLSDWRCGGAGVLVFTGLMAKLNGKMVKKSEPVLMMSCPCPDCQHVLSGPLSSMEHIEPLPTPKEKVT